MKDYESDGNYFVSKDWSGGCQKNYCLENNRVQDQFGEVPLRLRWKVLGSTVGTHL